MAMKKNSKTSSMKTLWFVLGLILMIVSSQFRQADCRALRSTANYTVGTSGDCEQAGGGNQVVGMESFAVSSNNSSSSNSTRPLARSLAFRLASGPSKKGPGH
ncbi:hypothetical protein TIFTF001_005056 [Ficus carica]|uniref:Transmembrane protein n=1 Tax=Ficus carica TaxID=3494 RepID=A0AA88A091_FICCA|nr:hypothetical protein TIFTF001_005056 [Ficus carica]